MRSFTLLIIGIVLCALTVTAAPSPNPLIDGIDIDDERLVINLKYVRCVFHVVKDVMEHSPYQSIWDQYMPSLSNALTRFFDCADNDDTDSIYKCYLSEFINFMDILQEFYNKLESTNKDIVTEIRKNIKERCH